MRSTGFIGAGAGTGGEGDQLKCAVGVVAAFSSSSASPSWGRYRQFRAYLLFALKNIYTAL